MSGDAAELFDPGKKALDYLEVVILVAVELTLDFAGRPRWDHRLAFFDGDVGAQGISIVGFVCQYRRQLHCLKQCFGPRRIVSLSRCEDEARQLPQTFNAGMDFGAQSSARTTESMLAFFFATPAAC